MAAIYRLHLPVWQFTSSPLRVSIIDLINDSQGTEHQEQRRATFHRPGGSPRAPSRGQLGFFYNASTATASDTICIHHPLPLDPMSDESTATAPRGLFGRYMELFEASLSSRYMQANVVYLIYTSIILYINLRLAPKADEAYTDDVCVAAWLTLAYPPPHPPFSPSSLSPSPALPLPAQLLRLQRRRLLCVSVPR